MGIASQGTILAGQVQGVRQGAGLIIAADGTISFDSSTAIGILKTNNPSAYTAYVWPAVGGNAGQQLTSDGAGNLSWTAAGGTFTAKGQLSVGTGTNTDASLSVGTDASFLVADSSTPTGLKWSSSSTSAALAPAGTSTARPSPSVPGQFRYNTTTQKFEFSVGTASWQEIASGDPTTNTFVKQSVPTLPAGATASAQIPAGTTAQQEASPAVGYTRFNTSITKLETWDGATWVAAGGGSGTVTSVDVSGGTTGLTYSGGPVTASGTITMAGVLAVANGGTGQTTSQGAIDALLPAQSGNSGKYLTSNGSVTAWSATPLNGAASLAEAAAGTIADKYSSPQTAVPKDASGMAGAALLPGSAVAFSGTPVTGMIRYNNLTPPAVIEYYNGSAWVALGGLAAATLVQAAAGTVDTVANTPKTSVPKDAAGMTGAAILSSGTAAQRRATPVTGMTRVNTTNKTLEFYDGTQWQIVTSNYVADGGGWFGHSVHP